MAKVAKVAKTARVITTTIRAIDKFSMVFARFQRGVRQAAESAQQLQRIVQKPIALNLNAADAAGQLQQIAKSAKEAASATHSARQAVAQFHKELDEIPKAQNRLEATPNAQNRMNANQEKLKRKLPKPPKEPGKLAKGLDEFSETLGGDDAAKKLLELTVGGAMEQAQMENMLKARTGNDQIGAAMFQKLKADSLKSGTDMKDTVNSAMSFMPVSKNMSQLSQFEDIAQRLNVFDTGGQGMDEVVSAIKEALSGDAGSLADNFNIPKSQIESAKLEDYGKAGDVDNFLKSFNKLLEMQHMGQEGFDKMLQSPTKQAEMLQNKLKVGLADAGQSAVQALAPITVMLNKAFESGKFQSVLGGLSAGLSLLANLTAEGIQFMLGHWNMLKNMLVAVSIVLGVLAVMWIIEWLSAIWPVLAIIGVIGLVIKILNYFGVSTTQVVEVIGGLFYGLVATITNLFAMLWNVVLSFAEFLVNVFTDPGYAVKKLMYDLAKDVGGGFIGMINSVIGGFNKLVDKIPKLKEFKISPIGEDWLKSLQPPTKTESVVDFSKYKLQQQDLSEAYGKGKNMTGMALNSFKGMTDNMNADSILGNWKNDAKIQRVDTVGKIDDKVDVSSEDLKVMRDLAEMKAVQNFVTLTPTLQVTTGDLHEKVDVDEMIHRIGERMESAISSSAEGVFI